MTDTSNTEEDTPANPPHWTQEEAPAEESEEPAAPEAPDDEPDADPEP